MIPSKRIEEIYKKKWWTSPIFINSETDMLLSSILQYLDEQHDKSNQ